MTQNIYDDAFSVSYARLDLEQLALPPSAKVYNRTASGCFPSSTRSSWRSSPPLAEERERPMLLLVGCSLR